MNLLYDRKILKPGDDLSEYFHPMASNLIDPLLLDNMDEGYRLLKKHLENGSKIYLITDSDVDGFTSASIFYNYLMEHLSDKYDFTIDVHIPEGKEHGLKTFYKDLLDEKQYDLIVVPDAGTNDVEECKALQKNGYDILILD